MSTLSIPNTFVNGGTINAAPFNANFTAIQTWSANIDNTNIGAAGLFASQILPTTSGQATFGGSNLYTFPAGVAAGGPLTATTGTFSGVGTFNAAASSTAPGLSAVGTITAGSATAFNNIIGGALNSSTSTTAGVLYLGGSVFYGLFDFNINNASSFTTSGPLFVGGALKATGAVVAGSATAGTVTAGDVWASRGVSSGALALGGSTTSGLLDFGVTTAGQFTANGILWVSSSTTTGTLKIGGTAGGGQAIIDYNITNANQLTINPGSGLVITQPFGSYSGIQGGNGSVVGLPGLYGGTAVPVFSAPNGSIYLRYGGTPGTNVFYTNTSGASTNGTTWTAHF